MDYSKPTVIIISGPNGAGKSTHIKRMLPSEFYKAIPFDRDLIKAGFAEQYIDTDMRDVHAMRDMERFLNECIREAILRKDHFVLETPLSHPDYWHNIDLFQSNKYQIQLNYLCLNSIAECIHRVNYRESMGGHYVEEKLVREIYHQNLKYIDDYRDTFDLIQLFDGSGIEPKLLAIREKNCHPWWSDELFTKKWFTDEMPAFCAECINP